MSDVATILTASICHVLRDVPLRGRDLALLVGRLYAWSLLSKRLPSALSIPADDQDIGGAELKRIWDGIAAYEDLGAIRFAFADAPRTGYQYLSSEVVRAALNHAIAIHMVDTRGRRDIAQWVVDRCGDSMDGDFEFNSTDVAEFGLSVLDAQKEDVLFMPSSSANSVMLAAMNAELVPDIRASDPPLAALISAVITNGKVSYTKEDPYSVKFLADHGQSRWEVGFVFPILGKSVKDVAGDGRIQTGNTGAVDLALKYVQRSAVVVVTPSFLFSRASSERSTREDLVRSGRLRSVTLFPAGLLRGTGISFALLVLSKKELSERITLCRIPDSAVHVERGKLRGQVRNFVGAARTAELLRNPDGLDSIRVSIGQIESREFNLTPSGYLTSETAFFQERASEMTTIGDVVEIRKPQHLPDSNEDGAVTVREVGPGEIPGYGDLTVAQRTRNISSSMWGARKDQALVSGDVLLSVKGTIGKVAVVELQDGDIPLMPSLSFVILRSKRGRAVNPRFLALYLRSPVMQSRLAELAVGATILNIPLQTVRDLPLWLPDLAVQEKWAAAWQKQISLQTDIGRLKAEQKSASTSLWEEYGLVN